MYTWLLLCLTCLIPILANVVRASDCNWSTTRGVRQYVFNLGAPLQDYPHGVRSEDGSYEVREEGGKEEAIMWFQLCNHMKFTSRPPACQFCPKVCGDDLHCGETCSALRLVSRLGYSKCSAVAENPLANYSLIDEGNPSLGVAVTMTAGDSDGCPDSSLNSSLKVKVHCAANGVMQPPTTVREEPNGSCQYVTNMLHPSGCPIVTSSGDVGVGWLGTLVILLLCGIIVYFAVGLAYRTLVLGVPGYEAIPNLEFWQKLPGTFQAGTSFIVEMTKVVYSAVAGFVRSAYTRASSQG